MAVGLASSSRVHPSASFCTLGNPPSPVSGQRGLLFWLSPWTSPLVLLAAHSQPWQPHGSRLDPFDQAWGKDHSCYLL